LIYKCGGIDKRTIEKFEKEAAFAASLGQVHRATLQDGTEAAAKLQYPDMTSALEADLNQLKLIFAIGQRFDPAIRTDEIHAEITTRLREAKKPDGSAAYSTRTGLALLAFFVLACQCMSTVAAIKRETSSWRWPAFVVAYTYALGYAAAVLGRAAAAPRPGCWSAVVFRPGDGYQHR